MMTRLRNWWRAEAEKLAPLPWHKRLEYLFVYYKGWVAGLLVLLLFGWYVADVVIQGQKETILQGFFTNDTQGAFPVGELEKELAALLGAGKDQKVILDGDLYIDLTGEEATEYTAASNGKIIAYMAVGELDFVVTSGDVYRHFAGEVPMKDLSTLLPEELYARLSPSIEEVPDPNHPGSVIPGGLELSDSRFLRERGLEKGSFYLFVPYSAPHGEAICRFIEYAFG